MKVTGILHGQSLFSYVFGDTMKKEHQNLGTVCYWSGLHRKKVSVRALLCMAENKLI